MSLTIQAKHPLFVAEVSNVDLSVSVDDAILGEIKEALNERAVLLFRGPKLTQAQQIAFAERFGPLESSNNVLSSSSRDRISSQLADVSNLSASNEPLEQSDRRRMFGLGNQLWHTDSSFKRLPAKYSLLHAHSVCPIGGETQLVDTRAAYETLPEPMKTRLEGLVAEHSIFASRAKLGFTDFSEDERRALPPVHRALVRVHAESGRKALYLASHASHIIGWPVPEGRMLIHDLIEHATQPQFVYTHRWEEGDLLIWDNRCTLHRGRPFDENHRRDMRRATIEDHDPDVRDLRVA
ncbi:TauD/TfdA family dioxygenase [Bradyrhizobium sp. SK17]|uniref:TauD/TfdA dioxygenase family protein n=1 Tax=Bradyrhizobium sp. SK17 TaxID=2057741 RepID=UPI0012FDC1EC|nr:TauD/TfdA family dioxygenase [Bradyrhizobium sp. SK17]